MRFKKEDFNFKSFKESVQKYIKTGILPNGFTDKDELHNFCLKDLKPEQKKALYDEIEYFTSSTPEFRRNLEILCDMPQAFLRSAAVAFCIACFSYTVDSEANLNKAFYTGSLAGLSFFSTNLLYVANKAHNKIVLPEHRTNDLLQILTNPVSTLSLG